MADDAEYKAVDGMAANLARGRPATQSSVSPYSMPGGPEADAAGAVNGVRDGGMGFHTELELFPWWQVDLGFEAALYRVAIFNRQEVAERLRHFTVLVSADGSTFVPAFRKLDNEVFGADDLTPYVAELGGAWVGRFVRIRADAHTPLHFSECEVYGRPVDEEALRAWSRRVAAEEQAAVHHAEGRQGRVYDVGGFRVFGDVERYSPAILGAFARGDYEGREREIVRAVLKPGDRVLEVGSAVGAVAMSAAAAVGAEAVTTYDANPEIVRDARRNFDANGYGAISAAAAVLKARAKTAPGERTARFFISREFWSSRLGASLDDPDIAAAVDVPILIIEDEIARHRATVLICDIEGGEVDLLTHADLTGIESLILETHYWATGEPECSAMMHKLVSEGFDMDLDLSHHHVSYFRRRAYPAPQRTPGHRGLRQWLKRRPVLQAAPGAR